MVSAPRPPGGGRAAPAAPRGTCRRGRSWRSPASASSGPSSGQRLALAQRRAARPAGGGRAAGSGGRRRAARSPAPRSRRGCRRPPSVSTARPNAPGGAQLAGQRRQTGGIADHRRPAPGDRGGDGGAGGAAERPAPPARPPRATARRLGGGGRRRHRHHRIGQLLLDDQAGELQLAEQRRQRRASRGPARRSSPVAMGSGTSSRRATSSRETQDRLARGDQGLALLPLHLVRRAPAAPPASRSG